MKKTLLVVALPIIALLLSFLGGSIPSYLGGANDLDINGLAPRVGRPENSITVGDSWRSYGGDPGGHRYSQLTSITPTNVDSLAVAWAYSTGDLADKPQAMQSAASQGTPILVEDSLVFCTPFNEVIALDPGSGSELWRFDPEIDLNQRPANQFICRGVSHWRGSTTSGCGSRILMGTNDARLIALDARTGEPCRAFGTNGEVRIDPEMELWWPGEFQITSPPAIVGNTVIIGSAIGDNVRVVAPAGSVRAFDVRTGAPKWDFDPIPRAANSLVRSDWQGSAIPTEGHANAWAPMSVDTERGLVFLPTSSPSPDFYGGLRAGDNRHANSVVVLDGDTGNVVWSFQTVHHDVWDYDLPSQPGLYSVWKDGQAHEVVAQVTKTGLLFVLDRDTGKPYLPVEERAVPQGGAEGEVLSPTQPFPVATPAIVPNTIDSSNGAFGLTWFDKRQCQKLIDSFRAEGLFTPPSELGTILRPFTGGGANWGGTAFDPTRNLLVVNMSNVAQHVQLFRSDKLEKMREVFHDQEVAPQQGAPFGMKRELLVSSLGLPCTRPPWGVIAAVDLASGTIVWRKTLGTTRDLAAGPSLNLGTPTFGGPLITQGDLIFIGATMDHYLRALDVTDGTELWRGRLPAPAIATPITYEWRGRQYVVVYAGGNARMGTALSDQLVAFAIAPD